MKLSSKILVAFVILLLPGLVQAFNIKYHDIFAGKKSFEICQTGRQKALKQRGIKVTRDKDDLVRRTVRAHGGNYVRNGDMVTLTLNGMTFRDFSMEVVDGKYLIIITPGDSFTLEVVDKGSVNLIV